MLVGDIILILGVILAIASIQRGKIVWAGTIAMVTAVLTALSQNVVGDIFSPLGVTKYRYIETLIFLSMGFPIGVSFALKKFQLYLYMILSALLLASHFIVLKFVIHIDIGYDYLIFLTVILIPAFISIVNFNLIDESIKSLIWSKHQIEKWNKSLETVVDARTNELKEANRKLEAMSMTDGLTEVANRRKFDMHYLEEWNRAKRDGKYLTLLLLDVDQFKIYNDSFGHQQGDECLRTIARKLEHYAGRNGELVARYGGEEFGIIIPEVNSEKALEYAELVRREIESLSIPQTPAVKHKVVTVSIGVASRPILETDFPELLIEDADKALYQAKGNGRNRVELADFVH